MHTQIQKIEITAKVPGYLFALTCIKDINEKIFLNCSAKDYKFINSMLNQIGLQGDSLEKEPTTERKVLFVLQNLNELNAIALSKDTDICLIIYLTNETYIEDSDKIAIHFLMQYPNCIIVKNIEMTVSQKHFFIYVDSNHKYYTKLKKNTLRCSHTNGI